METWPASPPIALFTPTRYNPRVRSSQRVGIFVKLIKVEMDMKSVSARRKREVEAKVLIFEDLRDLTVTF